ncbi:TetR/AcrR family transcriptional regulator [Prevotella sp. 10(H)]|uniref:TetR/AcrR family transcriptional regulator n=1 Tax=Prevotella sp. 10(H) TaxID=1158294 RepID=UPI0004A6C35A|nr:TetR/AcrR family transcriptional regulator [Prevotella sp. 10(H)]
MEKDISTEERIKQAARKVFQEKGYGQARTRDIADAAGINLALLNYYFRSKEKLFDIIMEESMQQVFGLIVGLVNDEKIGLSEKIDLIVNRYIDSLWENPNLPLFVLSEIQANPRKVMEKAGLSNHIIVGNYLYKQVQEQIDIKGIKGLTPLHVFVNIVSMTVFPIVGRPLLLSMHSPMTDEEYKDFVDGRRTLIPMWIKAMLKMDE